MRRPGAGIQSMFEAACHLRVMGDADPGAAVLRAQVFDPLQHFSATLWVQGGGWFIRQEKFRFMYQCPRHRDTLCFSPGESLYTGVAPVGQPNPFQHLKGFMFCGMTCSVLRIPQGDGEVLQGCKPGQEIKILMYHTQALSPEAVPLTG